MSGDHTPFTQRLRDELIAAAHPERAAGRRRARQARGLKYAAAVLVVVAAVAVGTSAALQQHSYATVLSIQQNGDRLTVTLNQQTTNAKAVADELKQAHVDATVELVPVASALAGQFVSEGGSAGAIVPLQTVNSTYRSFTLSNANAPKVRLYLGRAAKDDENYVAAFDLFGAQGTLRCSGLWGEPASQVAAQIQSKFANVRWVAGPGVAASEQVPSASVVVDSIIQFNNDEVVVTVVHTVRSAAPVTSDCTNTP